MSEDLIHHYTNIDTLSLILKYKTIRFNRLDGVDDMMESKAFKQIKLANFLFVSCWTYDQSESIPQWNMYTKNMAGVRISLPKNPFWYRPLQAPKGRGIVQSGSIISPVPFNKMFTNDYIILPMFLEEKHLCRQVEYPNDYIKRKNNAIVINIQSNNKFSVKINDPTGIASLKSPDWKFQKEFRFVLLIFPSFPLPPAGPFSQEFADKIPNIVANSLYHGKGPNIRYIDLEIEPNIFHKIRVTTGPLCSEGDYNIVESLLEKYTTNSSLTKSRLKGTIRKL